jgi:methylthioribose-1-phosphate isomerase
MVLPRTLRYEDGVLILLDQRALPASAEEVRCASAADVASAIRTMAVRGAPAIGVSAAYGVAVAARQALAHGDDVRDAALEACAALQSARPTAVNLHAALTRMHGVVDGCQPVMTAADLTGALEAEAAAIEAFETQASRAMGVNAARLLPDRARVYVHCNTGALATVERGTALAAVYQLHDEGRLDVVVVGETRPRLQGARLTAYELSAAGVPHVLVVDSLAATLMLQQALDAVLVGADRVAANGDVANKVGTYSLAVACTHHSVPLYVVAPSTSIDMTCETGADVTIEERSDDEVTAVGATRVAPRGTRVLNPAFDITPASMVTALITERGIVAPVTEASLAAHLAGIS